MYELLSDEYTYKKLDKSPLDQVIKEYNSNIKSIFKYNKELQNKFHSKSSSLPYMYGLISLITQLDL